MYGVRPMNDRERERERMVGTPPENLEEWLLSLSVCLCEFIFRLKF